MSSPTREYDFVVIGAGSAGCAVAHALASKEAGSILVIEAGPSDRYPLVRMPFGLVWMMGTKSRDWQYRSTPQEGLGGRAIGIPRGKMIGGSGSINSMVWFRGRADDFRDWNLDGWGWDEVRTAFEEVESHTTPDRFDNAHPLTQSLSTLLGGNDPEGKVDPERESAGVFRFNMRNGRRWSAADAFLRPAMAKGVQVLQNNQVDRIGVVNGVARRVIFTDGTVVRARKGIVLSSGSIGSPEIMLRSGLGPADDLKAAGIDVVADLPGVGDNLHDHPGAAIFYKGSGSGYGLDLSLAHRWAAAPLQWALLRRGIFGSPTVEGGAVFNAANDGGPPDIQSHFIPFLLDWTGKKYPTGRGYFADACLCRPKSRGRLYMTKDGLQIDLGLFKDESDLDTLTKGWLRLRELMQEADFGPYRAPEAHPGEAVQSFEQARDYIRAGAGTAYHPVGTLAMGEDTPVTPRCKVRGLDGLWVADASVMPSITSNNTNAPSMMIGHRAGHMIAEDAA